MKATANHLRAPSKRLTCVSIVLGCGLAFNAFAASDKVCDEASDRQMQGLEVPVQELAIDVVDYPGASANEAIDLSEINVEALPPLFSLTPRVASVIDQVFSSAAADEDSKPIPAQPASPVADRVPAHPGITTPASHSVSETLEDDEFVIPGIQDQMFRKDI